jgi:hypothetical protein
MRDRQIPHEASDDSLRKGRLITYAESTPDQNQSDNAANSQKAASANSYSLLHALNWNIDVLSILHGVYPDFGAVIGTGGNS